MKYDLQCIQLLQHFRTVYKQYIIQPDINSDKTRRTAESSKNGSLNTVYHTNIHSMNCINCTTFFSKFEYLLVNEWTLTKMFPTLHFVLQINKQHKKRKVKNNAYQILNIKTEVGLNYSFSFWCPLELMEKF